MLNICDAHTLLSIADFYRRHHAARRPGPDRGQVQYAFGNTNCCDMTDPTLGVTHVRQPRAFWSVPGLGVRPLGMSELFTISHVVYGAVSFMPILIGCVLLYWCLQSDVATNSGLQGCVANWPIMSSSALPANPSIAKIVMGKCECIPQWCATSWLQYSTGLPLLVIRGHAPRWHELAGSY